MPEKQQKELKRFLIPLGIIFIIAIPLMQHFAGNFFDNLLFSHLKNGWFLRGSVANTDIARLRQENQRLLENLVSKSDLEKENALLKRMVDFQYTPPAFPKKGARVFGFAPIKPNELLYIDQGTQQNVTVGDWVLSGNRTLVGRVREVYDNTALVETLLSRDLNIAVRVVPIGRNSFATPEGLWTHMEKIPRITLLPQDADMATGDAVITSGRDGLFPSNLLLGTMDTIETHQETNQKTATLNIPFTVSELDYVFIMPKPR